MRIREAKKEIKRFNSLVKVAKKLGFHLSNDFSDKDYEYFVTTNKLKKHLPVMLELLKNSGFSKRYLLWPLRDMNEVEVFIAAIAMSKELVLDISDDKWELYQPEKFSAKELSNREE